MTSMWRECASSRFVQVASRSKSKRVGRKNETFSGPFLFKFLAGAKELFLSR